MVMLDVRDSFAGSDISVKATEEAMECQESPCGVPGDAGSCSTKDSSSVSSSEDDEICTITYYSVLGIPRHANQAEASRHHNTADGGALAVSLAWKAIQ